LKKEDLFSDKLREQLDNFTVDVPEIQLNKNNRIADYLFTTVNNPLDFVKIKPLTISILQLLPASLVIFVSIGTLFLL